MHTDRVRKDGTWLTDAGAINSVKYRSTCIYTLQGKLSPTSIISLFQTDEHTPTLRFCYLHKSFTLKFYRICWKWNVSITYIYNYQICPYTYYVCVICTLWFFQVCSKKLNGLMITVNVLHLASMIFVEIDFCTCQRWFDLALFKCAI